MSIRKTIQTSSVNGSLVGQKQESGLLVYLLILTGFFFLLEISFFIECNKIYLADFSYVTDRIRIPLAILPGVISFVLVQVLLHVGFCLSIWMCARLLINGLDIHPSQQFGFTLSLWFFAVATVLVANHYFFPNSKFSELVSLFFGLHASLSVLICFLLCWSVLLCAAFTALALEKTTLAVSLLMFALGTVLYSTFPAHNPSVSVATNSRPNIIIVGVDSLRPDFLSYFGREQGTPFIDRFLEQATVFAESVTPLARTFPSWTSILTGQYPRESGVRTNLANLTQVDLHDTLPALLQGSGYETIYATDETRFSNIDERYGFDRVVSAPMGLNDFLLGTFNDFPLSNLIVNTKVGRWLFPYSYGNRPVFVTYDPNAFLERIDPVLREPHTKPLFLAVHFCLPHSPYLWADLPAEKYSGVQRYGKSVQRVDMQLHDFFQRLQEYHLLDHAIVVLLSDHGEALELSGDRLTEKEFFHDGEVQHAPRFYPPSLDSEEVNQSAGHGTDVLGLTQYHTLLAFRLYGLETQQHALISGVVSLLDIKPTLLQLLQLSSVHASGNSLLPYLRGKEHEVKQHHPIFIESDFSPTSIRTVHPEVREVVLEGAQLFQVDAVSTRLTVKDAMNQMILDSKQYADIYAGWMLAYYPRAEHNVVPVLINLQTGEWTMNLQSRLAKEAPIQVMLKQLNSFYGAELGHISSTAG